MEKKSPSAYDTPTVEVIFPSAETASEPVPSPAPQDGNPFKSPVVEVSPAEVAEIFPPSAPDSDGASHANEISSEQRAVMEPSAQSSRPEVRQVSCNEPSLGPTPVEFWNAVQGDVDAVREKSKDDEAVRQLAQRMSNRLETPPHDLLAFDECRSGPHIQFVPVSTPLSGPVWFIGDLHGDLLSCIALTKYVENFERAAGSPGNYTICFLGDIVDRGPFDFELLLFLFQFILDHPRHVAYIVGNHDEGVSPSQVAGDFDSSVSPHEFCDKLNAFAPENPMRELANAAIQFFKWAPRALLLPGGLLAAHGGVPHVDRLEQLNRPEDFNDSLMLSDFVWTRLHETARKRVPNRTTRGCSLGYEDFEAFCARVAKVLDRPITAMIRGHDHVSDRYLVHERYRQQSVVTINSMCCKEPSDMFGDYERKPVAARWREGHSLEIHQLGIPSGLIRRYYPVAPAAPELEVTANVVEPSQ